MYSEPTNLKLWSAIDAGDLQQVENLYDQVPNAHELTDQTWGESLLHRACFSGSHNIVQFLLSKNFNVHQQGTSCNSTPLHSAAAGGHTEVARLLLEAGASPNAVTTNNLTPIYSAASRGHAEVVKLLVANGGDPSVLPRDVPADSLCPSYPIYRALNSNRPIKFSLQIVSDVHTEFFQDEGPWLEYMGSPPISKYIALLGDIGIYTKNTYFDFLAYQSKRYEKVFVLAGNHEYYLKSSRVAMGFAKQKMKAMCESLGNVYFMDKGKEMVDGVKIVGTTLWSNVQNKNKPIVARSLNDYYQILVEEEDADVYTGNEKARSLTVDDTNRFHAEEVQFIAEEIKDSTENNIPTIVLTHHAPAMYGTSAPEYDGQPTNEAFSTNLEHLMGGPVQYWAFGHTHYSSWQQIQGTHVISNQFGYIHDIRKNKRWSPDFDLVIYE